jgi:hypothetical protein
MSAYRDSRSLNDDQLLLAALAVVAANTVAVLAVVQQGTYGPEEDKRGRNSTIRNNNKRRKFDHGTLSAMGDNTVRPLGNKKKAKANLTDDKSVSSAMTKEIASSLQKIESSWKDIASSLQKIESSWKEIESSWKEIESSSKTIAECQKMEQIREDIKLYIQLGMPEQVGPLLDVLASMRTKMMMAPPVPSSITARTTTNISPRTFSSDTSTLLESPVRPRNI